MCTKVKKSGKYGRVANIAIKYVNIIILLLIALIIAYFNVFK